MHDDDDDDDNDNEVCHRNVCDARDQIVEVDLTNNL